MKRRGAGCCTRSLRGGRSRRARRCVGDPRDARSAPAAAPAPAVPNPKPALQKPLDLRIGDVRKYMMPNEFRAALDAPDAEKNTVVVEAKRELLPVEYEKPIPRGPLGPLFWALKHPTQSWRIFLPDLNRAARWPARRRAAAYLPLGSVDA